MLTTSSPTVTIADPVPRRPAQQRVDALRRRLDEVDATLMTLLLSRRELSLQIHGARMEAGGPRIQLSRESEILRRYTDALGRFGDDVGHAVLRLCRSGQPPRADAAGAAHAGPTPA